MHHETFVTLGQLMYGEGPYWKTQLAWELNVRADTVHNWSKGRSRIPPNIVTELMERWYARVGSVNDLPFKPALDG